MSDRMSRPNTATPQPAGQRSAQLDSATAPMPETSAEPTLQPNPGVPPSLSSTEVDEAASVAGPETVATSVAPMDANKFQLFQELHKTAIRIEYGEGPDEYYTVHLELLSCYSTSIKETFAKAEPLKQMYTEASELKNQLKGLIMSEIASETSSPECAKQAMQLIHNFLKQFPLKNYQPAIEKWLTEFAEENLFNEGKKIQGGLANPSLKKVEFRKLDLTKRIQLLNQVGIRILSLELRTDLAEIKASERAKAPDSRVHAAAQGRIILHNEDRKAVRSIVDWVYGKQLNYDDAEHLCKLYSLAVHLDILDLAQSCLSILSSSATSCLQRASANDVSLLELLRSSNGNTAAQDAGDRLRDIVPVIFRYVFSSARPPKALEDIVIGSMSERSDPLVFKIFKAKVNNRFKDLLVEALYKQLGLLYKTLDSIKVEHNASELQNQNEEQVDGPSHDEHN